MHEVGYNDLRTSIDHTLNATGQSDLIFIGHSEGVTDFFILAAEVPEYNDKIRVSVNMGPVVLMKNAPGVFLQAASRFEKILLVRSYIYTIQK